MDRAKRMNILLTGSSGFIGSNFINKYKDTYNIDRFSLRKNKIEEINFTKIDTIVHLAALVHQMGGADNDDYQKINVKYTYDLAKKAKDQGVKHFVFMSTVKVYGEESVDIYTENSVCVPIDPYGISKLESENKIKELESEEFIVSIIRTPIVYGIGVKANILNLIKLIKNVPILPFSNIKNKRSMVYVLNLCALLSAVIENKKSGIYLASDEKPISTTDLIKYISKAMNKNIILLKIPFFESILKKLKPSFYDRLYKNLELDNTQTKKNLNFKNPYTSEEGISKMVESFR